MILPQDAAAKKCMAMTLLRMLTMLRSTFHNSRAMIKCWPGERGAGTERGQEREGKVQLELSFSWAKVLHKLLLLLLLQWLSQDGGRIIK